MKAGATTGDTASADGTKPDTLWLVVDADGEIQTHPSIEEADHDFDGRREVFYDDARADGEWPAGIEGLALFECRPVRWVAEVDATPEPDDSGEPPEPCVDYVTVEAPPPADPALLAASNRALAADLELAHAERDAAVAERDRLVTALREALGRAETDANAERTTHQEWSAACGALAALGGVLDECEVPRG